MYSATLRTFTILMFPWPIFASKIFDIRHQRALIFVTSCTPGSVQRATVKVA
jgi:hypothetical protein